MELKKVMINLLIVVVMLISSIMLIWMVSTEAIRSKKILRYLPIFLSGVSISFNIAIILSGIYYENERFGTEMVWWLYWFWILFILIKNKNARLS